MKVWPWSQFQKLNDCLEHKRETTDRILRREEIYRHEYLKMKEALRGTHKGIRRLKARLKRVEAENAALKAELEREKPSAQRAIEGIIESNEKLYNKGIF